MRLFFLSANLILALLVSSCSQTNLCESGNCTPTKFETPTLIIDLDTGEFSSDNTRLFGEREEPNQFLSTSLHQDDLRLIASSLSKRGHSNAHLNDLTISAISYILSPNFFTSSETVQVSKKDVIGYAIHYYDTEKKMYRLISKSDQINGCNIEIDVSNISMSHLWQLSSCLNSNASGDIIFLREKVSSKDRPTRFNSTIPRVFRLLASSRR
ncbi:hypothetical protein FUA23_09220 [Neolewinella aurantiaca]|uniref:Lipoprotein n=1 Tax=Neolewinella aurantiaca TaxID=2602767 RepID=A0A5C7FJ58_9BACT|nr:hypothetical protein [Neolewinella aurantiaca]TXF89853.1 hypothetical protein FUA23_09220 [Neolewinella aurantiaca]